MADLKGNVVRFLREEFPDAEITSEDLSPSKFVINIVWDGFSEDPEPVRQNIVWSKISGKFNDNMPDILQHLAFILTWTAEESEAYNAPDN